MFGHAWNPEDSNCEAKLLAYMDISENLADFFPNETFAQVVIVVQLLLFGIWLMMLVRGFYFVRQRRIEIDSFSDIDPLIKEIELGTLSTEKEARSIYVRYAKAKSVDDSSFIYELLQLIFLSGIEKSELSVGTLVRTAAMRVQSSVQPLRSVLSLFIVLGLLGTLFGLSTSLAGLSTIPEGNSISSGAMPNSYLAVLRQLSGAFTPSVLGVLLTIIGVIAFAFLQKRATSAIAALEVMAVGHWARKMLPTAPQQLFKQLQRSEEQLQENLAAAQEVARFANEIRDDAVGLKADIDHARVAFQELRNATRDLVIFSENFGNSVLNLPAFQDGITELNRQTIEDAVQFRNLMTDAISSMKGGVNESLGVLDSKLSEILGPATNAIVGSSARADETLEEVRGILNKISENVNAQGAAASQDRTVSREQMEVLLSSFKAYEKAYLESRGEIDAAIVNSLKAAEKADNAFSQHNDALIEGIEKSVGSPLRTDLAKNLTGIPLSLNEVKTKLSEIRIPLDDAAERMSQVAGVFKTTMEGLVREIRAEKDGRKQESAKFGNQIEELRSSIKGVEKRIAVNNGPVRKPGRTDGVDGNSSVVGSNQRRVPPEVETSRIKRFLSRFKIWK